LQRIDFSLLENDILDIISSTRAQVKDYIEIFKWFSGKSAIRDILYELNARNVHSQNEAHVQFVPTTPLKDFSSQDSTMLLEIMKTKSKPINKRRCFAVSFLLGAKLLEKVHVTTSVFI